jgi:prevent-host-death family protein
VGGTNGRSQGYVSKGYTPTLNLPILEGFWYYDHSCNYSYTKGEALEVSKSELKAKMFEYLRQIQKTGEKLIVTDFGKPVLVILPYSAGKSVDELFADVRGKVALSDEVVLKSTADEWGDHL